MLRFYSSPVIANTNIEAAWLLNFAIFAEIRINMRLYFLAQLRSKRIKFFPLTGPIAGGMPFCDFHKQVLAAIDAARVEYGAFT